MKRLFGVIFMATLTTWLLAGCGGGSGSTGIVQPPTEKTPESVAINLAVLDTLAGGVQATAVSTTQSPSFNVTITGKDADKIYNGEGVATTSFSGVSDFLTFYVRALDSDYPLVFRVVTKASGYVTNSQTLTLDAAPTTATALTIKMTPTSLPPQERNTLNTQVGIDVVSEAVSTTSTGVTTQDTTLLTNTIAVKTTDDAGNVTGTGSGASKVIIPAGTALKTTDGTPVSGSLSATVTYHNPIDASSLETFPGGLTVEEAPDGTSLAALDPTAPTANFVSGGFTSVEITDDQGNEVRNFDSPITVTLTVPQNQKNPETGTALVAGDIIPLWSYDTDTGKWTAHKDAAGNIIQGVIGDGDGDGVVDTPPAQDTDGNWIVAFPTTHLSYFNLDWWFWKGQVHVPGQSGASCDNTLTINGAQGQRIEFWAEAVAGGFTHEAWLDADSSKPASAQVPMSSLPSNLPMRYTAYLNSRFNASNRLNSISYQDLCQPGGITFDIDQNKLAQLLPAETADLIVNVADRCTNDLSKTTPIPSNGLIIYETGNKAAYQSTVTDGNGQAIFPTLVVGKTYVVQANSRSGKSPQTTQATINASGSSVNIFFHQECTVIPPGATGATGGTGGSGNAGGNL